MNKNNRFDLRENNDLNYQRSIKFNKLNLVSKLKSIGKLMRNIYNEMNMMKRRINKHVIFSDSLGLDLEFIHTVVQNECDTTDLKSKIIGQIDRQNKLLLVNSQTSSSSSSLLIDDKILIPKFNLNTDKCYQSLIKNGICLNSIEIYNQSSIRGLILTLTNNKSNKEQTRLIQQEMANIDTIKSYFTRLFKNRFLKQQQNQQLQHDSTDKLDLVYVIWSKDDFKTWKYQASIQNNCKENFLTLNKNELVDEGNSVKTHEFFIQNLDNLLDIGENIKIILCHQIGSVVFSDTNNQICYNFECAFRI